MDSPLVSLRHVSKMYGSRLVFRDISLELAPGSLTLIIGPNGAGKSTLLRILAGLDRPAAGEIVMDDELRVAYLGHATFIYPGLTALENLLFWAKAHRMDASVSHLMEILKKMNLHAYAGETAGAFSRGMAQRLNFARILCLEPQLLLLDEPFTGLDSRSRALMRKELKGLLLKGTAIALVSHALDADRDLADQLLALEGGRASYLGQAADFHDRGEESCQASPS